MSTGDTDHDQTEPSVEASRGEDLRLRLTFRGSLNSRSVHRVWCRALRHLERARPPHLEVDAAAVTYCDSSGATMIRDLQESQQRAGGSFELAGFPTEFAPVLSLLRRKHPQPEACPPAEPWLVLVGRTTMVLVRDLGMLVTAIGEITAGLASALLHPRCVRWRTALRAAQTAGVNSLPIVLLVSGLLGMILALQSAPILHDYGADLLLANLIGLSFLRELGPLMTAVVLTARSGSAFAAEIGTMKINEEVDALRTMGVDPIRFLVVPRVIAAIVMTPLLTALANVAGISGGFLIWRTKLDLSLPGYVVQLESALRSPDFYTGLVKSVVFGTLIAGIGCLRGMETEGSPSAVGRSTTSAVASGIVVLAVADAIFTLIFNALEL